MTKAPDKYAWQNGTPTKIFSPPKVLQSLKEISCDLPGTLCNGFATMNNSKTFCAVFSQCIACPAEWFWTWGETSEVFPAIKRPCVIIGQAMWVGRGQGAGCCSWKWRRLPDIQVTWAPGLSRLRRWPFIIFFFFIKDCSGVIVNDFNKPIPIGSRCLKCKSS